MSNQKTTVNENYMSVSHMIAIYLNMKLLQLLGCVFRVLEFGLH